MLSSALYFRRCRSTTNAFIFVTIEWNALQAGEAPKEVLVQPGVELLVLQGAPSPLQHCTRQLRRIPRLIWRKVTLATSLVAVQPSHVVTGRVNIFVI